MKIGHSLLDSEHEHIVGLISDFGYKIKNHIVWRDVMNMYGEIVDCLLEHFVREEQIMVSAKYPYTDPHRSEHSYLFERLTAMTLQLEAECAGAEEDIILFLDEWFYTHVMISDRKFAEYLARRLK